GSYFWTSILINNGTEEVLNISQLLVTVTAVTNEGMEVQSDFELTPNQFNSLETQIINDIQVECEFTYGAFTEIPAGSSLPLNGKLTKYTDGCKVPVSDPDERVRLYIEGLPGPEEKVTQFSFLVRIQAYGSF